MFERYTEKARRVIFFARYEASQYGSPYIETEHLLLGLLREDKALAMQVLPAGAGESIHKQIDAATPACTNIPTRTDLPLNNESQRVLAYSAEEAERLADKHIGSEHLLLALLREKNCFAERMLRERGVKLAELRVKIGEIASELRLSLGNYSARAKGFSIPIRGTVEIHGSAWDAGYVRDAVGRCQEYSWHWHKRSWHPRDVVIAVKSEASSFELSLAEDTENFRLVKGGWKKDHCAICRWELFESKEDPEHGSGYTNGREWLCTECYEKFWKGPNFFSSAYSEIT
jgi:Clp amino terminal domain, pathogenicity island component